MPRNIRLTLLSVNYRTLKIRSIAFVLDAQSRLLKSIVGSHVSRTREFCRRGNSLRKTRRWVLPLDAGAKEHRVNEQKGAKKIRALCCTQSGSWCAVNSPTSLFQPVGSNQIASDPRNFGMLGKRGNNFARIIEHFINNLQPRRRYYPTQASKSNCNAWAITRIAV